MQNDERCCGTGTCIVNADGVCWCGQRWDGEKMCQPLPLVSALALEPSASLTVEKASDAE